MSNLEHARHFAKIAAQSYSIRPERLTDSQLVERMELLAYDLARDGDRLGANTLFVAVAGLVRAVPSTASDEV